MELQSPAYELAEILDEPRRYEAELELANSSLKLRSRWTSIRPHLNLGYSGSEAATDSQSSSLDSNLRSNFTADAAMENSWNSTLGTLNRTAFIHTDRLLNQLQAAFANQKNR